MARPLLTLFLDTNSLLHFPPIKDVDWCKVCDADVVKLMMCMEVIDELDEKKNDSRLGATASGVIKEIRDIRSSGQPVRSGVTLDVHNHRLRRDDFPDTLSPDSADDRIVHLVKQYVEKTGDTTVAVYSEDAGMALRCESHGIAVITPDHRTKKPLPQTEQDRKFKEMAAELQRFKNLSPEIVVDLISGENSSKKDGVLTLDLPKPPAELGEEEIAELVKAKRWDLLPDEMYKEITKGGGFAIPKFTVRTFAVSQEENQRYQKEVQEYLVKYATWLAAQNFYERAKSLRFDFDLSVGNSGRGPVDDLRIEIVFPPNIQMLAYRQEHVGVILSEPTEPKVPEPPRSVMGILGLPRSILEELGHRSPHPELFTSRMRPEMFQHRDDPSCSVHETMTKFGTAFVIRVVVPRLVHNRIVRFNGLRMMFANWESAKAFSAFMVITAANLPDREQSELHFVVQQTEPNNEQ